MSQSARVVVARDTRPSGVGLTEALSDGVQAMGGVVFDAGVLTTPICHYIVRCENDAAFGTPTEQGYYEKTAQVHLRPLGGKLMCAIGLQGALRCQRG